MSSHVLGNQPGWSQQLTKLPLFKQVIGVLWLCLYLITLLALISYDPSDLAFNVYPPNPVPNNFIGWLGAGLAGLLYYGFGFGSYLFPLLFFWFCLVNFLGLSVRWTWKPLWAAIFLISAACLLDLQHLGGWVLIQHTANIDSPGGLIGSGLIHFLVPDALGRVGAGLLFGTLYLVATLFLFDLNPAAIALGGFGWYRNWRHQAEEERLARASLEDQLEARQRRLLREIELVKKQAVRENLTEPDILPVAEPAPVSLRRLTVPDDEGELERVETPSASPAPVSSPVSTPTRIRRAGDGVSDLKLTSELISDYQLPPLHLLTAPAGKARDQGLSEEQLRKNLAVIVETLRLFSVNAAPGDITPGATITRYEVYPAAGVRVDKIKSLSRDLARVLCAERINILAPIPGKDSVGIEVPNSNKVAVFLRELLESKDWQQTTAKIPIALGKDVYGKTVVADLAAMPHLLIGGTTGSGKSVCINCLLLSFLYRFRPDDLRLILIDPKQVEMQVYNDIPHLVVPVVTDPKKVMLALRWVIKEMENRYRILAKVGVRNIASFNSRNRAEIKLKEDDGQLELLAAVPSLDEEEAGEDAPPPIRVPREDELIIPDKLPYIVVIVDELADLMQTAPADVEGAVARLTAKARAAGIHLIVATQTPRREVVTGVIKTNIPARIAFQVPSGLDSRVILDENGAENLLGKGDLMYRPPGVGRLLRGQGAFVSDEEVQAVVKFTGDQAKAEFAADIHAKLSGRATPDQQVSEEDQRLIAECLEVIRQERRASTSNLQRRLRLGYNRAAYVIDYLERIGVLAPGDGAKPREILVDLDSYELEF